MKDEDKAEHQVTNELEASETKCNRAGRAIPERRLWLPVAGMFVLLCILVWLNEILDLPRLLLGAPHTPVNWPEAIIEMVLIASIGLLVVLWLIRGITERVRAEEALRESEERYRSLFEGVPVGLYRTTPEGGILDVNPAMVQMLGYPDRDSLLKVDAAELYVNAEDRRRWQTLMEREGLVRDFEAQFRRRDGTILWGQDSARAVLDSEGRVLCYEGAVEDITESKWAAERLRKERDRVREYLDIAEVMLVALGQRGEITLINRKGCRILGYEEGQLIGKNWFDTCLPAQIREDVWSVFRRLIAGEIEPVEYHENPVLTRWGEERIMAWHNTVLRDGAGNTIGTLSSGDDITERKRAEEALYQVADDLAALYEASQYFLGHLDTETIIESVCRLAVDRLGLKMAWVGLVVEDSFEVRPAFAYGFEEGYLDSIRVTWDDSPTGRGPTGRAIRTGQATVMNYIESDRTYAPWREAAEARGYRSSAALPLCHGEQVLGALNVYSAKPAYFTDERVQVLQSFANQAATGIEKARLLEAEQQARQIAEILRSANLALTQTLDLDTVLETLLDYLGQLVPYDGVHVMLLKADSRLAVRAIRGYERWNDPQQIRAITLDIQANPIIHTLLTTQESVLIPDTNEHPGWECLLAGAEHMRNWLGVPLVAAGKVIGLYSMGKAEPGFFTGEHLQFAESLSAQAAVAIQNAQLFEQVRTGRERLQTLSRQLVEVQEAERRHIARELHDEVGQALSSLKLLLDVSTRLSAEEVTASVGEAQALVNELITRVRGLSLDLRPAMLDDLGLLPTLLWHFERYTAQTHVHVTFKHRGLEGRFAPEVETAAYRIVQEALTNVVRHASVSEVMVRLWTDQDTLTVQVEDQGTGFEPEPTLVAGTTTGLAGMRERALLLGGQLTVESAPGAGTCVTAELPLGDPVEEAEKGREA